MNISTEEFQPIDERCAGCARVVNDEELGLERCGAYIRPAYWFENGRHCPLTAKGVLTATDIAKMAIKEGVVIKEGGFFVYSNQRVGANVNAVSSLFKRNKSLLADVKRKLGITDDTGEEQGKVRVGQQKQKKGARR